MQPFYDHADIETYNFIAARVVNIGPGWASFRDLFPVGCLQEEVRRVGWSMCHCTLGYAAFYWQRSAPLSCLPGHCEDPGSPFRPSAACRWAASSGLLQLDILPFAHLQLSCKPYCTSHFAPRMLDQKCCSWWPLSSCLFIGFITLTQSSILEPLSPVLSPGNVHHPCAKCFSLPVIAHGIHPLNSHLSATTRQ